MTEQKKKQICGNLQSVLKLTESGEDIDKIEYIGHDKLDPKRECVKISYLCGMFMIVDITNASYDEIVRDIVNATTVEDTPAWLSEERRPAKG